jgi:CheY-like chemotaxis protein
MTDSGSSLLVTPAQRALRRLLSAVFDDPSRATDTIVRALRKADMPELPGEAPAILDFARAHLEPLVAEAVGVRLAHALVSDFTDELANLPTQAPTLPPVLAPPKKRRSVRPPTRMKSLSCAVLVVDADRLRRAPLARALLRGGCAVTAADDARATAAALRAEKIDVAVLDGDAEDFDATVQAVTGALGSVAIVARSDDVARTNAALLASGARDFAVRAKGATAEQLLETIGRFVVSE